MNPTFSMDGKTVVEVLTQLQSVLMALTPSSLNKQRIVALAEAVAALRASPLDLLSFHPNQLN